MTTSITCSTTHIVTFSSSWIRRTNCTAAAASIGVSPDIASSSSSSLGRVASARAISSRFLSASVRVAAGASCLPRSSVNSSSSVARARASTTRLVRSSAPHTTFSSAVMRPKARTTCHVRATPSRQMRSGRVCVMSRPSNTMRPSSGCM